MPEDGKRGLLGAGWAWWGQVSGVQVRGLASGFMIRSRAAKQLDGDWTFHKQGDRPQADRKEENWQDGAALSLSCHVCALLVSFHREPSLQKEVWGRAWRLHIPR